MERKPVLGGPWPSDALLIKAKYRSDRSGIDEAQAKAELLEHSLHYHVVTKHFRFDLNDPLTLRRLKQPAKHFGTKAEFLELIRMPGLVPRAATDALAGLACVTE